MSKNVIPDPRPTGYHSQTTGGIKVYSCAVRTHTKVCGFRTESPIKAAVDEEARWHRQAHKSAWAALPRCPECVNGKHPDCDGRALDPITDELVPCACPNPVYSERTPA